MAKYTAHVISNTHWDREWRYPFQTYRMDLVQLMDDLLAVLDKRPDYKSFLLDSQTIILEDYLEIRPEKAADIRRQAEAGRIKIGPWYTLPDEWGCPGEAIVRNLVMGHRTGKPHGPIMKSGYTPFSNGQISQLPQILREFGIDSCFFYRGISRADAKSEFKWQGADGSWIYGFRFGIYARYNYYYLVYRPCLLNRQITDREYKWTNDDLPYHVASDASQDRQYGWLDLRLAVRPENLKKALADCLKHTAQDATTSQLLYMMGHDHSFPHEMEVELIKALQEAADPAEQEVIFSTLDDYLERFRKEEKGLEVLKGEMRHVLKDGLWTTLMANILSCRLYLKQRNAKVNADVIHIAEPLAACAWLAGAEYPTRLLELAWKDILRNQAHDAIGGCSVDAVHNEMMTRWDAVEQIAEGVSRRAMSHLLARIDGSAITGRDMQLTVFNTLPFEGDEMAEFNIDLPDGKPGEPFALETLDGRPVAIQILGEEDYTPTIESPFELSLTFNVRRFRTLCDLRGLPAMGHDVYRIRRGVPAAAAGTAIATSDTVLENAHLRVEVAPDGTIALTDKRTGRVMRDLLTLEDTAEFGDPWNRVQPAGDTPILSRGRRAVIRRVHTGPLAGVIAIDYTLPVPRGREGDQRSAVLVDIPVSIRLTLRRDATAVDVALSIDNIARDHRLRVLFPSGIAAATHSTADGQYDVLQRAIKLPDATGWKEKPFATHPMWSFVDVSDGQHGLGIVADGLIEQEVKDDADRTIAITLLRGFGKFVYGRPTPGSQCLGPRAYRFQIVPHTGDWRAAGLLRRGQRHLVPVQAIQSAATRGTGPARQSFLRLDGADTDFGAIKLGEDNRRLIVRVWNSADEERELAVTLGPVVRAAERVTMEELPVAPLSPTDGGHRVAVRAEAKKIVTIALTVK
jgi:hypothetical protein